MAHILTPGRTAWCVEHATQAGVLLDGRDYYRALYDALQGAERYVALTGWQFDSDVALLRGEDLAGARGPVRLLPLLEDLLARKPGLRVYVLAWDFSLLFALEREWMQRLIFGWTTTERLGFRFDASAPLYGAHHQKLALVDGEVAFTGGMDVADQRWDDRRHAAHSVLRADEGRAPHGPYHDVQVQLRGPVVARLAELFEARWQMSGGGPLQLPRAGSPLPPPPPLPRAALPLPPGPVALSRTFGRTLVPPQEPVQEVRALYVDAIASAERFVYVENQYFSARALFAALVQRMRERERPALDVVLVLPHQPEALKEQVAMGLAQARLLRALARVARATGHRLGVYCTAATGEDGRDVPTYVHSKVLAVDDRLLTVGSANTTNRSLGLDSELNVAWEVPEGAGARHPLARALRRVRVSLMAEHAGSAAPALLRALARGRGLVDALDRLAASHEGRLRFHALETLVDQNPLLKPLVPEDLVIDPEDSVLDEQLFERFQTEREGLFASGVRLLTEWLVGKVPASPAAMRPVLPPDDAAAP